MSTRIVLIPDDYSRRDIERVVEKLEGIGFYAMAAQFREHLPKPALSEPMGLGAVVRDREGVMWQRIDADPPWFNKDKWDQTWDQLNVVEILSEGWQG